MTASPFLFGKLPAHGDFVARGLSDADRDAWDAWSTSALDTLRHATGDGFEETHGAAPPWRFVARGEGGGWRAGALSPSMDGAGRRYLLAIGLDGLDGSQAGAVGLQVAEQAESLIYEGLAQGFSADTLHGLAAERFGALEAATALAAPALAATPAADGAWWTLGSPEVAAIALSCARAPVDLFARTVPLVTPSLESAA